jgi:hypothetical protein
MKNYYVGMELVFVVLWILTELVFILWPCDVVVIDRLVVCFDRMAVSHRRSTWCGRSIMLWQTIS